ncbi:LAGLIDADG family homing endonuclease [Intrasporangium sp. YIM S08009]|uniref:LAGLIDADG family homing endonuclease n=1 Tax=Intrasporangium zincisolvens TaxID=3080018 RepID=UPI002B054D54|nr:LAGLIDADG family homing endonuclease [Intrasporangium sp. YIM S08009]
MLLDPSRPAVAYLLGLLQTDGWHSGNVGAKGKVGIELQERDVEVLRQVRSVIPCRSFLQRRRRQTNFADDYVSYTLQFFDQATRVELAALGMTPGRKAYDLAPPDDVGLVHRDYLRGVLDGDGSVGFSRTGMPFISLVTASEPLARFFEAKIWQVCGVRRLTRRNSRDRVFNVMVANRAAATLAAYCWHPEAWPAIPRKAAAAAEVAAWAPPVERAGRYDVIRKPWTAAEDAIVLGCSPAESAEVLGRTLKSVTVRRWRLRNDIRTGRRSPLGRDGEGAPAPVE